MFEKKFEMRRGGIRINGEYLDNLRFVDQINFVVAQKKPESGFTDKYE